MLEFALFSSVQRSAAEGPDLTRYILVCIGLITLILFGGYGFKRLFASTLTTRAARRSLQIVDVLPLGGKQRLAVVRCYERTFVVGMGDKELCLVAELDAQSTPQLAAAVDPMPTPADQNAFQRLLRAARARPAVAQPAPQHAGDSVLAPEGVLG